MADKDVYGVLKARVIKWTEPRRIDRHIHLHVRTDAENVADRKEYRVTVNVRAVQIDRQDVRCLVDEKFDGDIIKDLMALPTGFHPLPPNGDDRNPLALDYLKGGLLDTTRMEETPSTGDQGTDSMASLISSFAALALNDTSAFVYAFGSKFGPDDPPVRDQEFGFTPAEGVHQVHMNQGGVVPYERGNATDEDGALFFELDGGRCWVAIFIAFQAQALPQPAKAKGGRPDFKVQGARRMSAIPFSDIRRVMERTAQLEQKFAKTGKKILHFEIGRPDFDTPQPIKQAAIEALEAGQVHYSSSYGILPLRQAIARKLERENGLEYRPDNEILVTVGANEAIGAAFLALLNPGDEVLVPEPAWLHYRWCAQLCGARVVPVRCRAENDFVLDPADVADRITLRTRMIVLNSPNNPTGAVYPREVLAEVAEIAKQRDLLVLSDEIYERMVYDGAGHFSFARLPGMRERTLTVNGLSKAYSMTGWRLGFVAAPPPVIDLMVRVHQYTVSGATTFAQYGAVAAYTDSDVEAAVNVMVKTFEERRRVLIDGLRRIPGFTCPEPRGAFYAFPSVKVAEHTSASLANLLLEEAGVAVVPGDSFGAAGVGHLRFSYAASEDDLREGIDRIAQLLEKKA